METKLTNRTDTHAELTVSLNEAELKHSLDHVYDHLRPKVKAAGFRPGKAPNQIVERELGSAAVQSEFIDHAIQDSYSAAIRELELPVIASPEVTLEKFVPYTELSYKAKVELMPKVKLADYKAIRLARPTVTVDPAEIDQTIEDLRRRDAIRLTVDRAAKLGDEVTFDFDGSKDGQPVRGASAKNHMLRLGSGNFIPGFETELVGMKPGAKKTFDITFPKDYHEDSLAGQVVTFAITMHKVDELSLPEIDEAFVEKISPFKTIDELRENIAETKADQYAEEASRAYEQQLLDKLLAESTFEVPEVLLNQQLARLRSELAQNLAGSGLTVEKYLELSKKTAEELDAEMKPEATKRVGLAMILTEVAAAEKLSVSADELDAEIARMKAQYPDEQTQAELDNPTTREEIYNHLMASRVIAKLAEYAETK